MAPNTFPSAPRSATQVFEPQICPLYSKLRLVLYYLIALCTRKEQGSILQ